MTARQRVVRFLLELAVDFWAYRRGYKHGKSVGERDGFRRGAQGAFAFESHRLAEEERLGMRPPRRPHAPTFPRDPKAPR